VRATSLLDDVHRRARDLTDDLVRTRRELHEHPELAFAETRTAALAARRCAELGYAVRTGVGGTGVVADLDGAQRGPTVLVRADMDALPIDEADDGRPSRSRVPGRMHACGHDGHVAIALAVATILADLKDRWSGRVRLCFQPAEETDAGAAAMLADGASDGVDHAIGLHLQAGLPSGAVALAPGALWAGSDEFSIVVRGVGGHAGDPGGSANPIRLAAQIAQSLDDIGTRAAPSVLTVAVFHAGTAPNVVPDRAELRGTLRSFDSAGRDALRAAVSQVAAGVELRWGPHCPPAVSDAATTARIAGFLEDAGLHVQRALPITASDDMARFLQRAPGTYFRVGIDPPDRPSFPHHHPRFDIDETALPAAAEALALAALALLTS
jgi:amidohydrolase